MNYYNKHALICINQKPGGKVCCANSGGEEFFRYLKSKVAKHDLHGPGKIRVSQSGCLGRCDLGPCIVVYPEGVWFKYASFEDIDQIVNQYFLKDIKPEELLIDPL